MSTANNIAILGCGWLGLPLAEHFIKKDFAVNGSTTSEDKLPRLAEAGISPYYIELEEHGVKGKFNEFLKDVTTLIIAFPPSLRNNPNSNFVSKMTHFVAVLKETSVKNIIYVSSTSVFKDEPKGESGFRVITEDTQPDGRSKKARQLIEGETLLKSATEFNVTILRFGGLIGKNRHPAKYLSGKTDIKNGDAPVNLIHLNDCIQIIDLILEKEAFGTVFHAVNPIHQTRREYYTFKAESLDLPKPEFEDDANAVGKVVHSIRLNTDLGFEFSEEI